MPELCESPDTGMAIHARDDWDAKLAWMREKSVTRATWSDEGALTSADAAPMPSPENENTAKPQTASEIQKQIREQRERLIGLTSGGPRLSRERIG